MATKAKLLIFAGALGAFALSQSKKVTALLGGRMTLNQVKALAEQIGPVVGTDPLIIRAIVEIESNRDPNAFRNEPHIGDASTGLMQVLLATAQETYDVSARVRQFVPARPVAYADLTDPTVSIALGAAYLNRLHYWSGRTRSLEWYVRGYNGGPGGAIKSYTVDYWNYFRKAYIRLGGADPGPATYGVAETQSGGGGF